MSKNRINLHTHGNLCIAVLTSVLVITNITPSYSETLGNDPQCDNTILHSYTGPVSLNATWNANTITLQWDGNGANQNYNNTSCIYDDGITLPTPTPTRDGYTFQGWRVVQSQQQQCSLSSVWVNSMAEEEITLDASHVRWKPIANNGYTMMSVMGEENSNDLNPGEWAVLFSTGEIKARALCSTTNGTFAQTGTPDETGGGQYCWCAGTSFGNQCNVSSPSWVFRNVNGNATNCAAYCASYCARIVANDSAFRRAVFGVTQ